MKFEGKQINIPINGIMRAGTDFLAQDGAMNEVVGVEYKDGSLLPYKTKDEYRQVVQHVGYQYVAVPGIEKTYVHKTNDGEKHFIFITSTGDVYYEQEQDLDLIIVDKLTSYVNSIGFIGNLICLSTTTGLEYYIWDNASNTYSTYMPKNLYSSLPRMAFRVTHFDEDHPITSEGTTGNILYARSESYNNMYPSYSAIGASWFNSDANKTTASNTARKAVSLAADKGRFAGAFIVCYAYRLKSGEYIAASAPLLMNVPSVVNGDGDRDHVVYIPKSAIEKHLDTEKYVFRPSVNSTDLWGAEFTPHADENDIDEDGIVAMEEAHFYNGEPQGDTYTYTDINSFTEMPSLFAYYHDTHEFYEDESGNPESGYMVAGCLTNLLQFRIISDIPEEFKNLVDSLCIFVSEQVSGYKDFSAANTEFMGARLLSPVWREYTASFRFVRKSTQNLRDDILKIKNLYCVYEVPFTRIKQSSDWETPDLEGRLGDVLYTQDSLPLTAVVKNEIISGEIDTYNRRLHVYNYTEKKSAGHKIRDFQYLGGLGQYYPDSGLGTLTYPVRVKATIVSESGESEVWSYDNTSPYYWNPIISYPSSEAKSIDVYIKVPGEVDWKTKHYDLMLSTNGGYSLFITEDLVPFVPRRYIETCDEPDTQNINNITRHPNRLRVSSAVFASYFPVENTYTIGNEEILKLTSLSIALSQDTFGRFPLLAFCKDGIYSLEVDPSGNNAYTNIPPFSREICVNKKTICGLDSAVVFASDKGLMIAHQGGVEQFAPNLNGKINFLPDTSGSAPESGAAIYAKMITNDSLVQLGSVIDTQDFIDYLQNANTVVSYISKKNKLVVYNKTTVYVYLIDIPSRVATKLFKKISWDDDNYPEETYWSPINNSTNGEYRLSTFTYRSAIGSVACLMQSRPIVIQQDDKNSFRVVLTGNFEGEASKWAALVVCGSIDGDHWRVIGVKEKKLEGGFHNLGALTERGSWKELMFIFVGELDVDSHIDSIDLTAEGRYNNKKR